MKRTLNKLTEQGVSLRNLDEQDGFGIHISPDRSSRLESPENPFRVQKGSYRDLPLLDYGAAFCLRKTKK